MSYTLLVIAVALTLMWLLVVRPQRRKQAQTMSMQDNLRVGDEIVTAGGLYGTIEALGEDDVRVEVAPGTTVRVARRAVMAVEDERPRVSGEPEPGEETDSVPPNSADAR